MYSRERKDRLLNPICETHIEKMCMQQWAEENRNNAKTPQDDNWLFIGGELRREREL